MAAPPLPSAEALALLTSLYAPPFLVQVKGLPHGAGWRLEISEDNGQVWTSLSPVGLPSPEEAIQAGAQAITDWRSSRTLAYDAEIVHFLTQGKLERRRIQVEDDTGQVVDVDGYAAQAEDGTWIEARLPIEAIEKAKKSKVKVRVRGRSVK